MNKKINTAIKYQLSNYRHTVLIMYLCVYIVILLTVLSHYLKDSIRISSSGGLEFISAITIFVVGLNSFKDNFKFFSANGVSRKTQLCSTVAALSTLSAVFAFIDTINSIIFTHITTYSPMFLQNYGWRFGYSSDFSTVFASPALTPQILFENFLWLMFLYFSISMIGLFITTLYYRMNKGLKIAVSIAVPVVLINGFEPLDSYFFAGKITASIKTFFNAAFGFLNGYNPYISMMSMFVFAAVFAALAFLLARRAVLKE